MESKQHGRVVDGQVAIITSTQSDTKQMTKKKTPNFALEKTVNYMSCEEISNMNALLLPLNIPKLKVDC